MYLVLMVLGLVLVAASLGTLGFGVYVTRRRHGQAFVLAPTILFAFGLMLTSVGWLTSPDVPGAASEAIRSGALASAAVLALYALWLNDQRRRTEQHRLETEQERGKIEQSRLTKELDQLGLERLRIVDERFTKAIELLGDASDRVRIGALILLDGLTRTRPELIPDVLDQICGYLRGPVTTSSADALAEEQDRRVRRHAQRVLSTVLRRAGDAMTIAELDLSGAVLDEFQLDGGAVGTLRLDKAHLTGRTTLHGVVADVLTMTNCTADDDVVLEKAKAGGRATGRVGQLVIKGGKARFDGGFVCSCDLGSVDIESAEFTDSFELSDLTVTDRFSAHAKFHRRMTMTNVVFATPPSVDDNKSIELFMCEFGDLVVIDDTDVHGATRLAGVSFDGGLRLNARFHGNRISAEDAFVAGAAEVSLPVGWRLAPHSTRHQRLVAPRR
jgi:hypothetical protein